MIRRGRVLEKSAIDVLADLFRLQKFGIDFDANDLFCPIEFVLLDLVEAVNFFVNRRSKRRRRDFFFRGRVLEVAVNHILSARIEDRH